MNKKRLVLRLTTILAIITVIIASLSCIAFAASNSEESEQLQFGASEAETVYWVPKGEVYHLKKTCRALNRSTTIKEGAVAESGKSRVCQICGKGSSGTVTSYAEDRGKVDDQIISTLTFTLEDSWPGYTGDVLNHIPAASAQEKGVTNVTTRWVNGKGSDITLPHKLAQNEPLRVVISYELVDGYRLADDIEEHTTVNGEKKQHEVTKHEIVASYEYVFPDYDKLYGDYDHPGYYRSICYETGLGMAGKETHGSGYIGWTDDEGNQIDELCEGVPYYTPQNAHVSIESSLKYENLDKIIDEVLANADPLDKKTVKPVLYFIGGSGPDYPEAYASTWEEYYSYNPIIEFDHYDATDYSNDFSRKYTYIAPEIDNINKYKYSLQDEEYAKSIGLPGSDNSTTTLSDKLENALPGGRIVLRITTSKTGTVELCDEDVPETDAKGYAVYYGAWYAYVTYTGEGSFFGPENGLYQEADGITYLYKDGRVAQDYTGFYQIAEAGQKYYVKKGIVQSGWISDSNKWYYMDSTGIMTCGWKKISGKWYFFDKSGVMQNGWVNDGGKWYYMDSNGSMTHGWQRVSNKWYYLGWTSDSDSGAMRTEWIYDGGKWYYMNSSGAMETGWIKHGNTWYYLKGSGAMAANEYAGGYWLNANGSWTYPYKATWRKSGNRWWYGDGSGWYAANTVYKIDGVEYSFDAAGWMK